MLNADTAEQINKQIAKELETVDSWIADDSEKDAALNRATKLKKMLDPNPDPEQLMDAFVQALAHQQAARQPTEPTVSELFADIFRR
jgi:hypothetical protein